MHLSKMCLPYPSLKALFWRRFGLMRGLTSTPQTKLVFAAWPNSALGLATSVITAISTILSTALPLYALAPKPLRLSNIFSWSVVDSQLKEMSLWRLFLASLPILIFLILYYYPIFSYLDPKFTHFMLILIYSMLPLRLSSLPKDLTRLKLFHEI